MKTLGLLLFGCILIFGVFFAVLAFGCEDDWCAECAARGFPVMESSPRQCKSGNKTFAEETE